MCLSIPMRVKGIKGSTAVVEKDGVSTDADISLIDDIETGDYVLVHAGFAIEKWEEDDIQEYNRIIQGGDN
ncbi:MAG: HypC/HybG/HupF family hydrogenase formation chaperone [Chitinivibrionales bacterium]